MKVIMSLKNVQLGQIIRFQSGGNEPYLKVRSGYLSITSGNFRTMNSININQNVQLLSKSDVCGEYLIDRSELDDYIRNSLNYSK